jgi:hypothetical protein
MPRHATSSTLRDSGFQIRQTAIFLNLAISRRDGRDRRAARILYA